MLRWLGKNQGEHDVEVQRGVVTTDDPLATITAGITPRNSRQIYSVSRSVMLPRVALRSNGGGTNPIFIDNLDCSTLPHKTPQLKHAPCEVHSPDNPSSSGYGSHGGSSHDPLYSDNIRLREDTVAILEQNANFVKSILVAVKNRKKSRRSVGSLGSSGNGTLSTIPEGKIDSPIPRPVWPKNEETDKKLENTYDSIVDDALLLYTSLSYVPEKNDEKVSAKDILKDLSDTINSAVEGKVDVSPELILKTLNERLSMGLDLLNQNNEDDIRRLSMNLSNSDRLAAVLRAFNHNSSSGNSTQGSPEWNHNRINSTDASDEIYLPSSSSGFSDSKNIYDNTLPVFVHEDLSSVPNGVRNAMIYGTFRNNKNGSANEKLLGKENKMSPGKFSLLASPDAKPSVWEIYYGAGVMDSDLRLKSKNTDTPYFPAGRPEADFTLDVPRSELLSRKMKAAKKWRFRCRLVTSFLGLVFFLLSLMAVSLMLTKGKRMFGSMV